MRSAGLEAEVRALISTTPAPGVEESSKDSSTRVCTPLSRTAAQAIGYKELLAHLNGEIPRLEDAFDLAVRRTRQFARRQRGLVPARSPDPLGRHLAKSRGPRGGCTGTLGVTRRDGRGRPHMTLLQFSKLHATGNDFLVRLALDADANRLAPETVARLCDRHRGIGADGLITIGPGDPDAGVDCTMRLQNADGGDAEMSGNGIRCLAWVAARAGLGTPERADRATRLRAAGSSL